MNESASPEQVVADFISAMHQWELRAQRLQRSSRDRPDPSEYRREVTAALAQLAGGFCSAEQVAGLTAASAFSSPPQYDLTHEKIVGTGSQKTGSVFVETEQRAVLGSGRYRYLLEQQAGRWLITERMTFAGGRWKRTSL
jgi:hypothetical protein